VENECEKWKIKIESLSYKKQQGTEDFKQFDEIVEQFKNVVQSHEKRVAKDFADDEENRLLINEVLDAKAEAFGNIKWQQTRVDLHSHDFKAATCVGTLEGHSGKVRCVAFHPTKRLLATGSYDGSAKLWRLEPDGSTATCVATLEGHSDHVRSVAFHPTAPILATGSNDNTAKLWRLEPDGSTATCAATLEGHIKKTPDDGVVCVAFHPTKLLLATGSGDTTANLWRFSDDGSTVTCEKTLEGHTRTIDSVAFHPSAPILATGSTDLVAKLWR
jgi:WD40 repeat protein